MCAIFGIACLKSNFGQRCQTKKLSSALGHMEQTLAARGPDGRGAWTHQDQGLTVLLGHRRLSILGGADSGAQPATSPDGRWTVTFNGQIYNFTELAKTLAIPGFDSSQDSDTTVLLWALQKWGLETTASHLEGMFAFAAWDSVERKLFLTRDKFGIKPVYWHWDKKQRHLIFASRLEAIMASGLMEPEVDQTSLASFLRWGAVLPPKTIFKDIKSLVPGTILAVDARGVRAKTFTQMLAKAPEQNLSEAFLSSLELTARSHVPFGLFLSGGIDSSAIACGLKKIGFNNLKTFTLGFGQHRGSFDESGQAKDLSKSLGFENFCLRLSSQDLADNFADFVRALDQPSTDGFNTFLVSKLAAQHVKVAFSGLGADELFFGYPQMRQFLWASRLSQNAKKLILPAARAASGLWPGQKMLCKFEVGFLPAFKDGNFFASSLAARELFSAHELESLGFDHEAEPNPWPDKNNADQIRLSELAAYTGPVLLRDTDALSMNFGLEVRVPFLNQGFSRTSFALPHDELFGGHHRSKPALCNAVQGFVPEQILSGSKKGFVLPMGHWIEQTMSERLAELRKHTIFGGKFAQKQNKLFSNNPLNWRKIWALLVLDEWMRGIGKVLPNS